MSNSRTYRWAGLRSWAALLLIVAFGGIITSASAQVPTLLHGTRTTLSLTLERSPTTLGADEALRASDPLRTFNDSSRKSSRQNDPTELVEAPATQQKQAAAPLVLAIQLPGTGLRTALLSTTPSARVPSSLTLLSSVVLRT